MLKIALGFAAASASALTVAIPLAAQAPAAEPTLEQVRALTERFQDVKVALAEGYVRDPMNVCDTAPMMGRPASLGAMGIHFFRPDLLGIKGPPNPRVDGDGTHTDFRKPAILIYEPQADGSLKLVAVENLDFQRRKVAEDPLEKNRRLPEKGRGKSATQYLQIINHDLLP